MLSVCLGSRAFSHGAMTIKLTVSKTNEFVSDYNAICYKKLKLLKRGCFTHIFNTAAQKIYAISIGSRWALLVSPIQYKPKCEM